MARISGERFRAPSNHEPCTLAQPCPLTPRIFVHPLTFSLLSLYDTLTSGITMEPMTVSHDILHVYEPLPGTNFIRLMHVEPALHADAPIHFSFQTAQLEDIVGQYEAISYTWGEPKLIHPLYISDGTSVLVTRNLGKALRRLRYPATTRVLWADVVCINQVDNDEKSKQIPLMAKIFRGAKTVSAWLDGGAEEERGMLLLDQLSRYQLPQCQPPRYRKRQFPQPQYQPRAFVNRTDEDELKWKEDESTIHNFLSLPWFDRLWINQEVVMNTDVILHCGTSSITWLRFTAAMKVHEYLQSSGKSLINQNKLDALQVIIELWKQHNTIGASRYLNDSDNALESISYLVGKFRAYGCADPRDRIFALYNMAWDIHPSAPPNAPNRIYMDVDYSSDIQQTYQKFATACLAARKDQSQTIMHEVLLRQYPPVSEDWPSWVPDWRKCPDIQDWQHDFTISSYMLMKQVDRDVVALQSRNTKILIRHYFLVVDGVVVPPDTGDGPEASLITLCRRWPEVALIPILTQLLTPRCPIEELKAFADYINRTCGVPLDGSVPIIIAQTSLKLQAAMRHKCFFVVLCPLTGVPIVGIGHAAVRRANKVLIFVSDTSWMHSVVDDVGWLMYQALVLRSKATLSGVDGDVDDKEVNIVTHRLIGSAIMLSSGKSSHPNQWGNYSNEEIYLS
jgi:hypothetical protein